MGDRQPSSVSIRSPGEISVQKPPWGFWKGLVTGVLIEVPALTFAVWALARLGIGNPDAPVMRVVRLTAVFAGVAAVFTAGGIGRLAAYASIDGGRRRAVQVAARAHAAASAGLVVIAAIPHGDLPGRSLAWLAFPAAGALVGAGCGALIGLIAGGAAPVELGDVWSLAKKPSEALRSWLDPRELVRLGAAVRHRTSHLFDGMFEPAQPPPTEPAPTDPARAAPEATGAPDDAAPPGRPERGP
jgi:hypothetical protein